MQIQLVDLFTTPVIKMMTLRFKPKRPYNPRSGFESYNVHFQNLESQADLRCSGPQCLLRGLCRSSLSFAPVSEGYSCLSPLELYHYFSPVDSAFVLGPSILDL